MTLNELVGSLKRIWYVLDTEDENKRECVELRDALPMVKSLLVEQPDISSQKIWDTVSDNSNDCPVEEIFYSVTLNRALADAKKHTSNAGEMTLEAFVSADCKTLSCDVFSDTAKEVCIALSIDAEELSMDDEYWCANHEDGETVLNAVVG